MVGAGGFLGNMSSVSRSYADVRPRRVEPPPTVIQGARVRADTLVALALPLMRNLPEGDELTDRQILPVYRHLLAVFGEPDFKERTACEDQFRTIIQRVVEQSRLIGCLLVDDLRSKQGAARLLTYTITDHPLALAILSKTAGQICVMNKRPVLTPGNLRRELLVRDPRIAALAEAILLKQTTQ